MTEVVPHRVKLGTAEFVILSELATALGCSVLRLRELYPKLPLRQATAAEESELSSMHRHPGSSSVTLINAADLDWLRGDEPIPPAHDAPSAIKAKYSETVELTRSCKAAAPGAPSNGLGKRNPTNVLTPFYASVTGCASQADEEPEELVPIRLDIDKSGCRVRDTFTWNLRETTVTPKGFALQFCLDEELPGVMVEPVTYAIEEQIAAFKAAPEVGERVVRINLSFQVGTRTLQDSFLWNHSQMDLTPESFAETMCADVGLGGLFKSKIAHSIREQLLADRKAVAASEPGVDVGNASKYQVRTLGGCFRVEGGAEWAPMIKKKLASEYERKSFQEALDGRLRKRMRDSMDDGLGDSGVGTRRSGRARKEPGPGDGTDPADMLMGTGRRSGRSRKEVVYAPPARGMLEQPDGAKAPVVVNYTDKSVFPKKEEAPEPVLSEEARALVSEQTALPLTDEETIMLAKLREYKPQSASYQDDYEAGEGGMDGLSASAWLESPLDLVDPLLAAGDGNIKYYKDNAFNRKLGRVGQVKILKRGPYGPRK